MRKTDTDTDTDREKKILCRAPDRLISRNNLWFFSTRQGETDGERGPFKTKQAAVVELNRYVDTMEFIEENISSLPTQLNLKDVTIIDMDERPRSF